MQAVQQSSDILALPSTPAGSAEAQMALKKEVAEKETQDKANGEQEAARQAAEEAEVARQAMAEWVKKAGEAELESVARAVSALRRHARRATVCGGHCQRQGRR